MFHREDVVYAGQVFGSQLILISGENHAVQLGVGQPHAEVQDQVVVSRLQHLDDAAEEAVLVFHRWN